MLACYNDYDWSLKGLMTLSWFVDIPFSFSPEDGNTVLLASCCVRIEAADKVILVFFSLRSLYFITHACLLQTAMQRFHDTLHSIFQSSFS